MTTPTQMTLIAPPQRDPGSARAGLDLRALSDDALMQRARDLAAQRRRIDAASAEVAGELARRSQVEFGYDGLAQRLGARTPEKLVSALTGVSAPEARSLVTVGSIPSGGWLEPVTGAVASGGLGVATAAAIASGLGEPNADIGADSLGEAARKLAIETVGLSPEAAGKLARQARDELDAHGVVDREAARREKRYLRFREYADGSADLHAHLDPESYALAKDAFDRVTMPRRGGPRFVDSAVETSREESALRDPRTIEQTLVDALVQFIVLAAAVDDGTVFGVKSPAVRLHVRADDLEAGVGLGVIEGTNATVGMPTIERYVCQAGVVPVLFDDTGQAVNLGRQVRPFSSRQRIAIAARDGGCMMPGCDRPPSWTEVHHCQEWSRGGRTDLVNGISLCRHHHMWLHNTGHRITHDRGRYWLQSPEGSAPRELRSKHPLHRSVLAHEVS
jgi:hypothetical protein